MSYKIHRTIWYIWIYWYRFGTVDQKGIFLYLFITQAVLMKTLCCVQAPTLPVLYCQVAILACVRVPILRKSSHVCGHYLQCHGAGTCSYWHDGDFPDSWGSLEPWHCGIIAEEAKACCLPNAINALQVFLCALLMWPPMPGFPRVQEDANEGLFSCLGKSIVWNFIA